MTLTSLFVAIAVQEGCDAKLLQSQPHIVALSRSFYNTELLPLLARWLLVWLKTSRLQDLTEDQAYEYLVHGPNSPKIQDLASIVVSIAAPTASRRATHAMVCCTG